MSSESLEKLGLFFDDLNRIRVWEPEAAERTNDLKDECKEFVSSEFKPILFVVFGRFIGGEGNGGVETEGEGEGQKAKKANFTVFGLYRNNRFS